ncbi:hypothetical protein SETIT_3G050500v2 [Setaria italica]|uniref:Uncharacterized protein n=3 Tax=Setaria italica TaxID=4555 RepID=A0A368QCA6_SETIT|nr:hypothetical protein SETIT_3G050500v2 [Setaria italica]
MEHAKLTLKSGDESFLAAPGFLVCFLQVRPNFVAYLISSNIYLVFVNLFSPIANNCFKCIMKEAELMYQLLQCKFDSTNLISFSNQIRRSALNLMMYNVDKSTAVPAAAAMVGLAREAKIAHYVLAREDFEHYLDYEVCDMIREGTTKVLTKLEREFASDTSGHSGVLGASTTHKSEEPEARTVTKDEELAGKPLQSSEPLK